MSLFVIADTHLSITTRKPMDIFGDRWKNHSEKLKTRWELIVKPDDTVVIPGDISWALTLDEAIPDLKLLDSLPGKKIISKGNHEHWWSTASKIEKAFKDNGIASISLMHNNAYFADGVAICGTRGWYTESASPSGADYQKIVTREAGRLERSILYAEENFKTENGEELEKTVFLHFPPLLDDFRCDELIDVMKRHNVKNCYFGHIHSRYNLPRSFEDGGITYRLVSADFLDFCPLLVK